MPAGSEVDLRLADSGDDVGRPVHAAGDARGGLVEQALRASDGDAAGSVAHAVALFRSRAATANDKRSAILALAGIIEARRDLIRDRLGKQDENALFEIANRFAIRHQRRDQQGDYDPVFLDWIFWEYLATVELTNRLLDRDPA